MRVPVPAAGYLCCWCDEAFSAKQLRGIRTDGQPPTVFRAPKTCFEMPSNMAVLRCKLRWVPSMMDSSSRTLVLEFLSTTARRYLRKDFRRGARGRGLVSRSCSPSQPPMNGISKFRKRKQVVHDLRSPESSLPSNRYAP